VIIRGSIGPQILVIALTSVACNRNALRPTSGAAGHGGSGVAGDTLSGIAGSGAAGTSPVGSAGQGGGAGSVTCGAATLPGGACVPFADKSNVDGVCRCAQSLPCACPGGCVDSMRDLDNCGACGVICGPTSICNEGVCGPAPALVSAPIAGCTDPPPLQIHSATAPTGGAYLLQLHAMTMTATDAVYFTDAVHGTVNKVGAATPLAMDEKGATMIQQVGTNLYWYATGSKKIRKMPAIGGAVTDVFTVAVPDGVAPLDLGGFLVSPDGATVYISLGTQVLEAPVAGGATSVVANEVSGGFPAALALNGTTNIVYPVIFGSYVDAPPFLPASDGHVDAPSLAAMPATCGMQLGPSEPIETTCSWVANQSELVPHFIAAIGGHAYWLDGLNLRGVEIGSTNGLFDDIYSDVSGNFLPITAAAATTDTIYFVLQDQYDSPQGFIAKTPLAPPSHRATRLARGQRPIAITVDATKVYWATSDCAIWSLNR
jgi:hypothetical protein